MCFVYMYYMLQHQAIERYNITQCVWELGAELQLYMVCCGAGGGVTTLHHVLGSWGGTTTTGCVGELGAEIQQQGVWGVGGGATTTQGVLGSWGWSSNIILCVGEMRWSYNDRVYWGVGGGATTTGCVGELGAELQQHSVLGSWGRSYNDTECAGELEAEL